MRYLWDVHSQFITLGYVHIQMREGARRPYRQHYPNNITGKTVDLATRYNNHLPPRDHHGTLTVKLVIRLSLMYSHKSLICIAWASSYTLYQNPGFSKMHVFLPSLFLLTSLLQLPTSAAQQCSLAHTTATTFLQPICSPDEFRHVAEKKFLLERLDRSRGKWERR